MFYFSTIKVHYVHFMFYFDAYILDLSIIIIIDNNNNKDMSKWYETPVKHFCKSEVNHWF